MTKSPNILTRAEALADHRQATYGLPPPRAVTQLLAHRSEPLGLYGRLRLWWYIYAGAVLIGARLAWNSLTDRDTPKRRRQIRELAERLRPQLSPGCRVLETYFSRRLYARDVAPLPAFLEKVLFRTTPHLIAQVLTEEDVVQGVRFAARSGLAVYPRGVASSPLGGSIPTGNGLVLDFSRMNAVVRLDRSVPAVIVQPGVRWGDLAAFLDADHLNAATCPTSRFSTIAGWAAGGGLGLQGYKYGSLHEAVLAARIVLPDGRVTTLTNQDAALADFLGTEGQLGIFTELTLRVQPAPAFAHDHLLTFADPRAAGAFLERLLKTDVVPAHVVFFDRGRLIEENRVFFDRTAHRRPVVPEADAVLAHFDDADANRRFLAHLANEPTAAPHIGPAARYLWAERFFPLKAQRLGPNLLAAEVLLAPEKLARFVTRARKLAARFGVELSVEAIFSRPRGRPICTVIAAYPADRRQPVAYGLRLLLVQLLIRLGLRLGGKPYGVGIWNAALITAHFDATRLDHLRRRKQELDTKGLLNPGKFFAVRSRFWNLPGLLFAPRVFHVLLAVAAWFSLPLGWLARLAAKKPAHRWMVPPVAENDGAPLLAQTSQRCTHCGACLSVCPAYALTGDELVTARAKLQLADVLLRDGVVEAAEAFNPFQCLRCGLCEEVCQTRLPLRDCYDRLEMLVDRRFGAAPEPLVREFIARVDAERRWIERTFGLDLADWSPAGLTPVLPRAHRAGGQR